MSTLLRVKCPYCGKVMDVQGEGQCRKCRNMIMLPVDAVIQIYSGIGFGTRCHLYLNDIPLGYMTLGESIRIPVQYGHYKVSMLMPYRSPMIRRNCRPAEFDLTPNNRFVFLKTHNEPGFSSANVVVEMVRPEDMPPL